MIRLSILGFAPALLLGCGSEYSEPRALTVTGGSAGAAAASSGGASVVGGMGGALAGIAGAASVNPQGGASGAGATSSGTAGSGFPGSAGSGVAGAAGTASCSAATPTSCAGACVNTASDVNHCGSCNHACSPGMSCTAGVCACAAGQSLCSERCVDVRTDSQNCGTCGNACAAGTSCNAGQCACAAGKALCNGSCADLMTDLGNCGACGTACGIGQSCTAGSCVTGMGGAMGPDGCAGLAANLTLSGISVYQTLEVPVMKAGAAVARTTDIVAGRAAVFRLSVTLGNGWTSRQISGRVFVDNGGTVDMYSVKKSPTKSSTQADADSTFQILVPKEKITPSTKYQAELVECGTSGGMPGSARFPTEEAAALEARNVGALKIKVVPLVANGLQPDTTERALDLYKAHFMALYPIPSIEITVGAAVTVSNARDWTGMLDQMRNQRRNDAPANDVYYYGLVKPAATFREYCGGGCTAGIGYVVTQGTGAQQAAQRASLGVAYADAVSANTMAHEIGHNHGRSHAPCVPQGASISGVDSRYPHSGGQIGVYGWDMRSMALLPPTRTDLMGYCDNSWISDYTYQAILTRVAGVNGAMADEAVDPAAMRPWRVVLLDDWGARWGIPIDEPSLPSGTPEPAEVLDAAGNVIDVVDVYRTEISDIDAASVQVPEPEPGWVAIRIDGAPELSYTSN